MQDLPDSLVSYLRDRTTSDSNPLALELVGIALQQDNGLPSLSMRLAAAFDLVVASKYYRLVLPENWLWCEWSGFDFYPTHNACPFCALQNRFVHHVGNKPGSGQIGPSTAEALREVLAAYFSHKGRKALRVYSGKEPVDVVILDTRARKMFIAEVKAAPLFTPPLFMPHSHDSMQTTGSSPLRHSKGIARNLHATSISLFLPDTQEDHFSLSLPPNSVGAGANTDSALAAVVANNPDIVRRYFSIWKRMWDAYFRRDRSDSLYWFCGACGLPRDPGEGWPKNSSGKPKGSISDGKTSVGMDRTDDIKKATFQVLKLGVESRKDDSIPWELKIGLASNLHAARHYNDYLFPYEDLVWGWAKGEDGRPDDFFNLFDGIISFTSSHTRDDWLRNVVDWHEVTDE